MALRGYDKLYREMEPEALKAARDEMDQALTKAAQRGERHSMRGVFEVRMRKIENEFARRSIKPSFYLPAEDDDIKF